MKRSFLLALLVLVAAVATMASSPSFAPPERDLIRMGPYWTWGWGTGEAYSTFGVPTFLRDQGQRFLQGHHEIAVHVDIYRGADLIGVADGTGPIVLSTVEYPEVPDGYVLIAPVTARWNVPAPTEQFLATITFSLSLLDSHGRVLSTASNTLTDFPMGTGY